MKVRFTHWIAVMAFLMIGNIAFAQLQTPLDVALRHIEENYKTFNLTQSDVEGMVVSDMYTNQKTGTTFIYFTQKHEGISMQNAIINVSILENGQVNFVGKRFIADLGSKVSVNSASLGADQALQKVVTELDINAELPRSTEVEPGLKYTYEAGTVSKFKILSELIYKNINDEIQLVWDIQIDPIGTLDKWEYAIDANTGQILDKRDMVIRCKFDNNPFHNHDAHCNEITHSAKAPTVKEALTQMNTAMVGSYNVVPFGTMSPNHGPRELVTDPNDPTASPFGWHDINGDIDPDFTYTRGNNVHALLDRNQDGAADEPEPDGGIGLVFDFPFDEALEPAANSDAAVTNLFYMSNIIHDFTYVYGFDEVSGNYQRNTYGNGGAGNDELISYAQAGADVGAANNAFFTPSPDGVNGTVNMFVWDESAAVTGLLNVDAPTSVVGQYNTGVADYGPQVSDVPITGEVVEVNDNIFDPYVTDGCEAFVNASEVAGKIALVDRGGCWFEQKTENAENAGAIALIICNFEDDPMGMAGVPEIDDPTIPTISIGSADCATIRQFAGNGLEVTIVQPVAGTGPDFLDGDFDNGIIAHEIGHGISNRLTGGPSSSGCLGNAEQMGEGWSDYFGLITSVKPGDTGDMKRGVGTYVQRQDINTTGIRQFPYSTDMSINPHTYGDVSSVAAPHGVGSVWCAIIWDLYWRMVDEYGFDNDQWYGDGGNNRAIWLVMEGMRNQVCQPGFVDGRDAILAADMDLYGGANQCLIWEVFARRGVGFYAEQGSSASQGDQVENFDALPTCVAELKISKSVTPLVDAGDDIDVSVEVVNHKDEQLTNVTVTEEMPAGTDYIDGSCSLGDAAVTVNGSTLTFDLGTMEYLDEITFTFQLSTDVNNFSIQEFYDDVENIDFSFWFAIPVTPTALNLWEVNSGDFNSEVSSWYVENVETESQQILQMGQPSQKVMISGANPVLRFYHNYETEAGADGGVIEVSTDDDAAIWTQLGNDMFRGQYNGAIQYGTFTIPNFDAFHGNSNGWKATYIDMSDYAGQEVILRWNFATDDNTAPANGYWRVDDIEVMDMINYNSEVCVTSDQGDNVCAIADGRGTVVESQMTTSIGGPIQPNVAMEVFPNPADNQVNLAITSQDNQNVTLSILTIDGREVLARNIQTSSLTQTFSINVSELPSGFYFVKASTNAGSIVEKVVIN